MNFQKRINKLKIINDPVYGFINIPSEIHYDIIQHPYFQRMRRLRQLGLSYYVYPGATHTRFDHVLGAMHLMNIAVLELKKKGQEITDEETDAVLIAILLHDIGHGPLSHSLEGIFIKNIDHEQLSLYFMESLNSKMNRKLTLGIEIFKDQYKKKFLHELVSSQLDMDRLDYLKRDSFYTGVTEGEIGSNRIIKMLRVVNDELVVEEKGIYSVEQFIVARRIMYWQVYLHKTVIAAEMMLRKAIQRAMDLSEKTDIYVTPSLAFFFNNKININSFTSEEIKQDIMDSFAMIDDADIIVSIKEWMNHPDIVLSEICRSLINRELFKVEISNERFCKKRIRLLKEKAAIKFKINDDELDYFVFSDKIMNKAYSTDNDLRINILLKSGKLLDIAEASDLSNITALSKTVEKYFLCYPKMLN